MPKLVTREIWPIIFVVSKTKNAEVTERIHEFLDVFISMIKEKEDEYSDYDIEAATYVFGDEIEYCTPGLVSLDDIDITFKNINSDSTNRINITKVLKRLNNDFSREKLFHPSFISCYNSYCAPTIIYILDGKNDYIHNGVESIKKNKWYNSSMKIAVVYNDYSENYDTILELIDNNPERLIQISDTMCLGQLIRPISVSTMGLITQAKSLQKNDLIRVDPIADFTDLFDNAFATKEEDTTKYKQFIAVPSNDKIHISGIYHLKKCQVSACEPDKTNNDIVIIETLHNGINVKNVSDMTLYTVRKVGSHDTRCFDYELGKKFLIDARKDAFVSFDFNQAGNLITIENMSDNDIDFVVELNEEPHFMQTDDMIFDFNGDVVLMVLDENDSAVTNIDWSENDFDDGGWD